MIRFCKNQMALCLLYNAILVYDITGNSIVWYIYKYYKENIVFHALMIWLLNFQTGSTLADATCLNFADIAENTLCVCVKASVFESYHKSLLTWKQLAILIGFYGLYLVSSDIFLLLPNATNSLNGAVKKN